MRILVEWSIARVPVLMPLPKSQSPPYDTEGASFALMDQFYLSEGYARIGHVHRETYMSDPRRVAPGKMRTVIRYFVYPCALGGTGASEEP